MKHQMLIVYFRIIDFVLRSLESFSHAFRPDDIAAGNLLSEYFAYVREEALDQDIVLDLFNKVFATGSLLEFRASLDDVVAAREEWETKYKGQDKS